MPVTYLGLGSNIGDRAANLARAVAALPPEVRVLERSPIYETPAWGYVDQSPFLNMVIMAQTDLPPVALLAHIKRLEGQLGRTPSFRWGPRLIDIDILLYDDLSLNTPDLTIPHAHLQERPFVLVPLADLAPDLVHPVLGKTVGQLLAALDRSGITRWSAAA